MHISKNFDADQILASVTAWQVEDLVEHEHANNVAGHVYFYCVAQFCTNLLATTVNDLEVYQYHRNVACL